MTALADLCESFSRARDEASAAARYAPDDAPPDTCRYCGDHWRRWAGSKLDGHAKCIVTDSFKGELAAVLRNPRIGYSDVALAIGVTPSVVRSWTFPIRSTKP